MRDRIVFFIVGAVALAAAACTPGPLTGPVGHAPGAPRERAVEGGESTGTVEMVRQQLLGVWDLTSLEMQPPAGGARVPIAAKGTLVYDEYANLTFDMQTTDPKAPEAARESNLMRFKGRAVIDAVKSELKLMDLSGNVDPNEVLSPDRRRRYEITMDTLKLSALDAAGEVTAISSWQRRR